MRDRRAAALRGWRTRRHNEGVAEARAYAIEVREALRPEDVPADVMRYGWESTLGELLTRVYNDRVVDALLEATPMLSVLESEEARTARSRRHRI